MKTVIKRIIVIVVVMFFSIEGYSQVADSTKPLYVRFPTIPQFTIYNAKDSSVFTREQLKKKKSTVIMIFNPECEHCQRETKEIEANIGKFKNAQIIMISYLGYEQMVKFYNEYHIADYPNITMGRDAKYFFPVYYKLRNLPSIFVYDKKGHFKKDFEGSVNVSKVAAEL